MAVWLFSLRILTFMKKLLGLVGLACQLCFLYCFELANIAGGSIWSCIL